MKCYEKNELDFVDGLIIADDNTVVVVDDDIVDLANMLETRVQKKMFLKDEPELCLGPDLSKFKRESTFGINNLRFTSDTPITDKKTKELEGLAEELKLAEAVDKANEMLDGYYDLMMFVACDTVVSLDKDTVRRFDTPILGNPICWGPEFIGKMIAFCNGLDIEFVDDDE